jgi:type III pantothenate kinase
VPGDPLLTIDQGNSTTDVCLFSGDAVVERTRLPSGAGEQEGFEALLDLWRPDQAVALSVTPERMRPVASALAARAVPLARAGVELPCPLRLHYPEPATLGADRWVGALAALRRHGGSLVIDCGTALTLNLVSAGGDFLGGGIATGFGTMVRGLAAAAPRLATQADRLPRTIPALSTEDSLRFGHRVGWCGLVDRLVEEVRGRISFAPALVVTGGEAEVYLESGRHRPLHAPDLTHHGLRLLWLERG